MRAIWMASAALLMSAGVACAQTSTTTTAPAPTGSVQAPNVVPPGASPGKTAPNAATTTLAPSATNVSNNNVTSAPAPDGAVASPATMPPNASPGRTAPSSQPMQPVSQQRPSAMGQSHHWHHWSHNGKMPENAGAKTYLHIAKSALSHHDYARADDALARAETRLLTRSVVQTSSVPVDHSPAVKSIEHARGALRAHDSAGAMQATNAALHEIHGPHHNGMNRMGPPGGNGMGGMGAPGTAPMGPQAGSPPPAPPAQ